MLVYNWINPNDASASSFVPVGGAQVGEVVDAIPCGDHSLAILAKYSKRREAPSPKLAARPTPRSVSQNTSGSAQESVSSSRLLIWNAKAFGVKLSATPESTWPILMDDQFMLTPTREGHVKVKQRSTFKQRYFRLYNNLLCEFRRKEVRYEPCFAV